MSTMLPAQRIQTRNTVSFFFTFTRYYAHVRNYIENGITERCLPGVLFETRFSMKNTTTAVVHLKEKCHQQLEWHIYNSCSLGSLDLRPLHYLSRSFTNVSIAEDAPRHYRVQRRRKMQRRSRSHYRDTESLSIEMFFLFFVWNLIRQRVLAIL